MDTLTDTDQTDHDSMTFHVEMLTMTSVRPVMVDARRSLDVTMTEPAILITSA